MKCILFSLILTSLLTTNVISKDFSGLNFNLNIGAADQGTSFTDLTRYSSSATTCRGDGFCDEWDNTIVGISYGIGYDFFLTNNLPLDKPLYLGIDFGGLITMDDVSRRTNEVTGGLEDYVIETNFRGHNILSGGLSISTIPFKNKDSKAFIDFGAAIANINHPHLDNDSGSWDFEDSPYIQDLVEGYYIGGGIEYLRGKNWGYRANIRHYDFAHMELNWTPKNSSTKAQYKYEDTLTQVEIGLVYYLRKK